MTTSIAIKDVRREVKILKALAGNKNLVQFYDAKDFNFVIAKISVTTEIIEFYEIRPKFRRFFLEIRT
jgi:alkyl hydroperoxide reductase subunit AhpC